MLDKAYDPKPVEEKWLAAWDKAQLSKSSPKPGSKKFVICIPPPNVTGALHLGHALNNTLQDVFIRWHKLQGYETCWVPGTDHGGIATQNVMEKQLKAEGKTRHNLGRDAFLERMQVWTRDCKKTILGQLRKLGCMLDWSRESFTMDDRRAKSVYEAFKRLWEKKLIYRGERMVNWCVRCGTALSDIEVEHEERKSKIWQIKYGSVVVATTRPETMLGDVAVAVNPKDERYKKLVGTKVRLPLTDRDIPIIADDYIDASFGTGALKVTPAHDVNDFEIGQRHRLASIRAIGPDGKIINSGKYDGLSREQARDKVLEDLQAQELLVKTEDHKNSVGVCYRCNSVIEPLLSWQWFVRMRDLAEPAAKALADGAFKIHPESWAKPYRDWLDGIRDWCVSRQIWWGHRIPVWYCVPCNKIEPETNFGQLADAKVVVSPDKPGKCASCGGSDFVQDPDVLDTWFSSGLWPFSVFGWPDENPELEFYYPTQMLVTGYEILYLWVARMQMMGLEFLGKVPFSDAIIHGIVRDKSGKKMSKSLGNVIDPLVMMDKFGTDALRFSLMSQAHPGKDIPFAEDSITGSRNFANKLWNSTRFVLMNLPERPAKPYKLDDVPHCCTELADNWILARYQAAIEEVGARMKENNPAAAAHALYRFLWDDFCDWYVELAKIRLQGIDSDEKEYARNILVNVLSGTLKLLHPFMPYVTEELYASLKPFTGEGADFILKAGAPELSRDWSNDEAVESMEVVMQVVTAIRSMREQLNVPAGLNLGVIVSGSAPATEALLKKHESYFKSRARLETISFAANGGRPAQSGTAVAGGLNFYVPLAGVVDFDKERQRIGKEIEKAAAEVAKIASKIDNPNFKARAPKEEVELAAAQHAAASQRLARLKDTLASLS
jgi:valyl-tRNA synthetase